MGKGTGAGTEDTALARRGCCPPLPAASVQSSRGDADSLGLLARVGLKRGRGEERQPRARLNGGRVVGGDHDGGDRIGEEEKSLNQRDGSWEVGLARRGGRLDSPRPAAQVGRGR